MIQFIVGLLVGVFVAFFVITLVFAGEEETDRALTEKGRQPIDTVRSWEDDIS